MDSNAVDSPAHDYARWSVDQLAERVRKLEKELRDANAKYQALANPRPLTPSSKSKKPGSKRAFDASKYSSRYIALKFAYLGQNYNGLEHHANNTTPLPTIEETLWAALVKARLIFPTDAEALAAGKVTWEGCDYSKCGRTDRGVSAFGQVVGLRVRSNRPLAAKKRKLEEERTEGGSDAVMEDADQTAEETPAFHPVNDEIPYAQVLNRLLPPDIRVLAWCPNPPADFNARFSCRERRYRYFFTQPAFNPTFGSAGLGLGLTTDAATGQKRREGWLDIEAMRDAAKRYEGLHDFRNLCKLDPSKQLTDFRRRIFLSDIREVDPASEPAAYVASAAFSEFEAPAAGERANSASLAVARGPKVYQFVLHGSAFLWHQVRHMVAILFLVGQGLERADVVDRLMDVAACPQKPHYEMADDAPLVLWDCIFPQPGAAQADAGYVDAVDWLWVGDEHGTGDELLHATSAFRGHGKHGIGGLVDDLWKVWRTRKMDEVLAGSLLNLAAGQGKNVDAAGDGRASKQKVYQGGDSPAPKGTYVPIMDRPRMEAVDVVNAKFAAKKGVASSEGQEPTQARKDDRTDHADA